ncbi:MULTISPECIES: nucleoside-diphosphate kinase [Photorhabdus]|uniref:nucleoside-diphosphate kinase n=1 Tax=Photorhabdus TaxID=29487 RepID=UPI00056987A8|nr:MULTISPECIES: nucleoside-diphosphate kinase [Photorhabdus]MBS9442131.1 nucleoside-diphosphate kinase [Photorhabdus heterorhabditis]
MLEKSFILIKPDAVHRGLVGKIITEFEEKGFKIHNIRSLVLNDEDFYFLYPKILGKPFHKQFKTVMQSAPSTLLVLSGHNALGSIFNFAGAYSNPEEDTTRSIRQKYSVWTGADVIHRAADSNEAVKQIAYFFDEVCEYRHNNEAFMAKEYWEPNV